MLTQVEFNQIITMMSFMRNTQNHKPHDFYISENDMARLLKSFTEYNYPDKEYRDFLKGELKSVNK